MTRKNVTMVPSEFKSNTEGWWEKGLYSWKLYDQYHVIKFWILLKIFHYESWSLKVSVHILTTTSLSSRNYYFTAMRKILLLFFTFAFKDLRYFIILKLKSECYLKVLILIIMFSPIHNLNFNKDYDLLNYIKILSLWCKKFKPNLSPFVNMMWKLKFKYIFFILEIIDDFIWIRTFITIFLF